MGTNYYLKIEVCPHCGVAKSQRHIGKSSMGWCFGLHIYPEDGIHDLNDWKPLFSDPLTEIRDEYGGQLTPHEMLEVITNRNRNPEWDKPPVMYESWAEFHRQNYTEQGPNGLLRHRIGQYCANNGEGTWDCIAGDFS